MELASRYALDIRKNEKNDKFFPAECRLLYSGCEIEPHRDDLYIYSVYTLGDRLRFKLIYKEVNLDQIVD